MFPRTTRKSNKRLHRCIRCQGDGQRVIPSGQDSSILPSRGDPITAHDLTHLARSRSQPYNKFCSYFYDGDSQEFLDLVSFFFLLISCFYTEGSCSIVSRTINELNSSKVILVCLTNELKPAKSHTFMIMRARCCLEPDD